MSIKKTAYELCKQVHLLPEVQSIRKLIKEITYTSRNNSDRNYGAFGYYAKQQRMQFLSYLLLNDRYEELSLKPELDLPRKLSNDDVGLLESAHHCISEINLTCLESIQKKCFPSILSIFPYFNIAYDNKFPDNHLNINSDYINRLAESFRTHTAINTINESLQIVPEIKEIPQIELAIAVEEITQRIYKSGLSSPPEEIIQLKHVIDKSSKQHHSLKTLLAISSLKSSLLTLTQILFQAFLSDKLISFDEKNIFSYKGPSLHSIGKTIKVSIQPLGDEFSLHPTDLIHLNIPDPNFPINELASIDSSSMSFSQEYGENLTYGLRLIDDDLSFFPNISK